MRISGGTAALFRFGRDNLPSTCDNQKGSRSDLQLPDVFLRSGRQYPQLSVVNYGGNFGGPFCFGGYSGTIIPSMNPGFTSFFDPDLVMSTARTIGIQAVTDGTSNTSLWSEMMTPPATPTSVVAGMGELFENRVFFFTSALNITPTPASVLAFLGACNALPPGTPAQNSTMGYQWSTAYPSYVNSNFNHVGTPNTRQCQSGNRLDTVGIDIYGTASPNSLHPGGVNVGFADGSVKFIKDSINPQTWWALGSRATGKSSVRTRIE